MPRHAFEALADVDDFLDLGVLRHHVLEDRVLGERLVQRHVERRRDLLGDPIDVGIRHVERAPDVPHHGLRLHRPEGDDLRDVLAAVLARDVVDHFAASPLAEVHVDIGQRHALGVQEALEDEIELERIDVGDAHAPRHERAGCRSSSRSNRNTFLTRVADEVPDDEEVPRVPHLVDHLDLVLEATGVLVDRLTKPSGRGELLQARHPLREAFARDVLEVRVEREPFGDAKRRQVILPLRDRDVAALGDEHRVAKRLGVILEDSRHLLGRLQEELIAGVAKALRVVDGLPGADAEKDVVRLVVALPQVVHVVGRNERQLEIARERDDAAIDDLLLLDALVLHLEEEVVLAENVAQPRGRLERGTRLLHLERARDLALETAAQADQAGRMLGQQFLVDARPVVEPFGVAG